MGHHDPIHWYNPTLEDFEWRALPPTDEQALGLLDGSRHYATCTQTYREWCELGASIGAVVLPRHPLYLLCHEPLTTETRYHRAVGPREDQDVRVEVCMVS